MSKGKGFMWRMVVWIVIVFGLSFPAGWGINWITENIWLEVLLRLSWGIVCGVISALWIDGYLNEHEIFGGVVRSQSFKITVHPCYLQRKPPKEDEQ